MNSEIRQHILNEISDMVSNFLYYHRKDDEELPRGEIEKAVASGTISVNEMVEAFRTALTESL